MYEYVKSTASDLPSNNTLDDYAQYREVGAGIDVDGIENLASDHASESVSILCDVMKVKDGLVCDINTGRLAGYTDINIDKDLARSHASKREQNRYICTSFHDERLEIKFQPRSCNLQTTTATTEVVLGAGRHCGAGGVERSC